MMASDSTVIRTLRIKTALPDRLAARLQTERALQASSLRPIGLPRDAILIVRQIKSRHAGSAGWEQAVNAQLISWRGKRHVRSKARCSPMRKP